MHRHILSTTLRQEASMRKQLLPRPTHRNRALACCVLALLCAAACASAARAQDAVDPATVLRKARFVMVRSDSAFVSGHEVEGSLLKRKEFRQWGMVLTRSEAQ